ncbi:unnamed protein product, partial [Phaeothamnion confervicola]
CCSGEKKLEARHFIIVKLWARQKVHPTQPDIYSSHICISYCRLQSSSIVSAAAVAVA